MIEVSDLDTDYRVETVRFDSQRVSLAGLLFVPAGQNKPHPGVVVLGPIAFVKEQSPSQYATRLAREGFTTLVFDPRYCGESAGEPRRLEDPAAKIEDVNAAVTYLLSRPEVDPQRIFALGVCQGSSEMIAAVAANTTVKALALISGQYLYRENLLSFFGGGGPTLDERIARGTAARERFLASGEVEYTALVSPDDKSVALPWPEINAWYQPWLTPKWGEPSRWENRYATMSDALIWTFDVDAHAEKLGQPTLIVHGERSDGGIAAAQHVYDRIAAADKKLITVAGVFHTRFYDDPVVVEAAASQAAQWFQNHNRPH